MTQTQDRPTAAHKAAWILMIPDGDPTKHRASIKTSIYQATIVCVNNVDQAVAVCTDLVQHSGVTSITLCPTFDYRQVAKIKDSVGDEVGVNVCLMDVPNMLTQMRTMKKEGWKQGWLGKSR